MASEHSYAAVGTECGAVRIFDTNKSDMEQSEGWSAGETVGAHDPGVSMTQSQRDKSFKPRTGVVANHDNAIFDVKWSDDDAMIISTCADLSTAVWDTSRTGTTYEQSDRNDGLIARLRGHKASAKTSLWQGPSKSSPYHKSR
jgi:WD40 repeat protein